MPYFITDDAPGCSGFATIKEDGEVIGCHATKQEAIDQMIAVSTKQPQHPPPHCRRHPLHTCFIHPLPAKHQPLPPLRHQPVQHAQMRMHVRVPQSWTGSGKSEAVSIPATSGNAVPLLMICKKKRFLKERIRLWAGC